MKLTTQIEREGRVWNWSVLDHGALVGGGICRTKADAQNDAGIFTAARTQRDEPEDQQSCCMTLCEWPAITQRGKRHLCAQCAEAFDAGVLFAQSEVAK